MEGGIPKGTQVGSYVVDTFLGRGGMGVVYRAYHPRLDRWAAIKLLPPFQSSSDARDRFEREARAVAKLRHRHVLSVFDFGEFAGQPYMVVEYMPNGSLADRMPKEPLTVVEALAILRPLGEALDYAHQQGVLHRDVKPGNVFLDRELQPVLADFGLAKLVGEQSLTASGMISGTPTHISPEQTQGKPLDPKSDLYSLAVIGFQLLAGRLPFVGDGMMDLLYAHVHTPAPAATSFNPALPLPVDTVLFKALAKDPAVRWPTAAEMIGALEAAGAGRIDERRPRPSVSAAVAAPEEPTPESTPPKEATTAAEAAAAPVTPEAAAVPPARRPPWPLVAGAVVLLLAASGAGYELLAGGALSPGSRPTPAVTLSPGTSPTAGAITKRISVNPPSPLQMGRPITVTGTGLDPKRDAGAGVFQGGVVHPISGGLQVQPDGSFSVDGIVPNDISPGAAALVACNFDAQHRTDLSLCIQLNVTIVR
jgi:serine/threonine-protein kinase